MSLHHGVLVIDRIVASVLLLLACASAAIAQSVPEEAMVPVEVKLTDIAVPGSAAALRGAFVGAQNGRALVIGGAGGSGEARQWNEQTLLVSPGAEVKVLRPGIRRAHGATVTTLDGVLLIGGISEQGPTADVTRCRVVAEELVFESLASLPMACERAGAALLGGEVYVIAAPRGSLETRLWVMDLTRTGEGWREGPPLPGKPRIAPVVVVQDGAIHVIGGLIEQPDGSRVATAEAWAYVPRAREGSVFTGWRALAPLPQAGSAGGGWPCGQLGLIAQVVSDTAERAILSYNMVTDVWAASSHVLPGPVSALMINGQMAGVVVSDAGLAFADVSLRRMVRGLSWADYVALAAYFVLMGGIGFWFSRKQNSVDEFSLAGRDVKWWASGLSMFATGASSVSFLAIPAMAYMTSMIWLTPLIMMVVAFFIQGWLIFPMLRRMQITSTFEYLERRFNPPLRLIASSQAVFFQVVGRTSVVLVLPAMALSATTGMDVITSVLLMGAVTTIYTAIGGFEAVIWTDVIQGVLMFLAPVLVVVLVVYSLPGGFAEMTGVLMEHNKFQLALPTWSVTAPALWVLCIGALFQHTVTLAGDQPVVQRVFSTPLRQLRRTSATYITCGILIGVVVNAMGLALFAFFHRFPRELYLGSANDQLVPLYLVTNLPAGIAGLIIAAIFAAAMSTLSSITNSVATLMHQDFYQRLRPMATEKQQLRFLKVSSYVIGVIGTLLACYLAKLQINSMFATINMLAGLLGGGVVGVYSLGMFTKRANATGAIVGVVASVSTTLMLKLYTNVHWAAYTPFALIACIAVGYVASILTGGYRGDLTGLTVFTPVRSPEPLTVEVSQ